MLLEYITPGNLCNESPFFSSMPTSSIFPGYSYAWHDSTERGEVAYGFGEAAAEYRIVHVTMHLKRDKVSICDQAESSAAVQDCPSGADGKCHTACLHAQQGHHPVPVRIMPQTFGVHPLTALLQDGTARR